MAVDQDKEVASTSVDTKAKAPPFSNYWVSILYLRRAIAKGNSVYCRLETGLSMVLLSWPQLARLHQESYVVAS